VNGCVDRVLRWRRGTRYRRNQTISESIVFLDEQIVIRCLDASVENMFADNVSSFIVFDNDRYAVDCWDGIHECYICHMVWSERSDIPFRPLLIRNF